jgi:hypothetical protein
MTLTANPTRINLGGESSIITATVYSDINCTEPIPNSYVYFNTCLGGISYLGSWGLNIAPDSCWAVTNESGTAQALLSSELEAGNATVYALTGIEVMINKTVVVEITKPECGVTVHPDSSSKETESKVNASYYLEVRNIGAKNDTFALNVTSKEADFAWLNKTGVALVSGGLAVVELRVSSYYAGHYNTTVEAASANASANVTVTTVVKPFYNLSAAVAPEVPQTVAPGVIAQYTMTVSNKGNAPDRFHLTTQAPPGVSATVNRSVTELLDPEESAAIEVTISSALEGEHVVNLTIISEGNSNVNATLQIATVVTREGFEFDTGAGTYPSIAGVHKGAIKPNHTVVVKRLSTYPAAGTGGHAEYIKIWNSSDWNVTATWDGTRGEYHTFTFPEIFWLSAGQVYWYELQTDSYPLIIHQENHTLSDGSFINCTSFVDVNGRMYHDWIPAIKLSP